MLKSGMTELNGGSAVAHAIPSPAPGNAYFPSILDPVVSSPKEMLAVFR